MFQDKNSDFVVVEVKLDNRFSRTPIGLQPIIRKTLPPLSIKQRVRLAKEKPKSIINRFFKLLFNSLPEDPSGLP